MPSLFVAILCLEFLLPKGEALPSAETLTLKRAIELGLDFSPDLKSKESVYRESLEIEKTRWSLIFPTVDFQASSFLDSWQIQPVHSTYLKAVQPLYRGGLLTNGIRSGQWQSEIQKWKAFVSRQNTMASVIRAFLNLSQTELIHRLATQQYDLLNQYTKVVEQYAKTGRSRKMDLLQAQVNLTLSELERVRLLKEREIAESQMRMLLGPDVQTQGIVVETGVSFQNVPPGEEIKIQERVIQQNPELRILKLENEKQHFDNKIDLSTDLPSLDLEGIYGYKSDSRADLFTVGSNYYSLGLTLKIPLFSGMTSLFKRRVHSERVFQREQAINLERENLLQKTKEALLSVKEDQLRLKAAEQASQQGQSAFQLANSAFRNGTASHQDVLNAQRTRFDSEKAVIEAKYSYLISTLDLYLLLGEDLKSVYAK